MSFSNEKIGADFGRLDGTHAHMVGSVAKMNSQLDQLKAYLKPMVATWEGEASTSYQALQAKWDTAAADLNRVLQQVTSATADTNEGFRATEKTNAARF